MQSQSFVPVRTSDQRLLEARRGALGTPVTSLACANRACRDSRVPAHARNQPNRSASQPPYDHTIVQPPQSSGAVRNLLMQYSLAHAIARETLRFHWRETGGELVGLFTRSGSFVVLDASPEGRRARATRVSFFQDPAQRQQFVLATQSRYGYVHFGQWHSHHRLGLCNPSSGDVATASAYLTNTPGLSSYLMLITTITPRGRVRLHPWAFYEENPVIPVPLRLHLLNVSQRHREAPCS